MTEGCRAALWYSDDVMIFDTKLHGIKALRECRNVTMESCDVSSPEFGWRSQNVQMENVGVTGEYFMFEAKRLQFEDVRLKGKYSFQYIEDSSFENCNFDTKDAFWHAKNITVKNSTLKGEYLRDVGLGKPISIPKNYFPNDDTKKTPLVSWRSCANLLFSNWLNYFVYQTTPFDIKKVK